VTGVVLRCPNCGTTQPVQGQCEACHEAAVKFFCTNHALGLWLEGSACPQCGARFGDPLPISPAPAPAEPPSVAAPDAGIPPTRRPTLSEEPELWVRDTPVPMEPARPTAAGPDPFRVLIGALMSAARAGAVRADYAEYGECIKALCAGGFPFRTRRVSHCF
jgi:cell division septation protein DedD